MYSSNHQFAFFENLFKYFIFIGIYMKWAFRLTSTTTRIETICGTMSRMSTLGFQTDFHNNKD